MNEPSSIGTFDEERAAGYDDRIRRVAPGYEALQAALPSVMGRPAPDARVLVVGTGTGAEILAMARARPDWHFTAVDPSTDMLDRCRERVQAAGLEDRVTYVAERIEDWDPPSRFDGATAIFVSHFLQGRAAKRRFFTAIGRALAAGAPFAFADLFAGGAGTDPERLRAAWRRWCRETGRSGEEVRRAFAKMERELSFASAETLDALLPEAGFAAPTRFYQFFLWGAWRTRRVDEAAGHEA
jgi:tRNA (cmo5U34)-methyltransferase